jgi:hypothetical protein
MPHLLFFLLLISGNANAEIRATNHMSDVIRAVDKGTLLVFDIDNTLIEPENQLGSDQWYYFLERKYAEIDGLKESEAYEKATKVWNKTQDLIRMKPVEKKTPAMVREIQGKNRKTLGLTARSFEVAERTLLQLDSVGINFKQNGLRESDLEFKSDNTAKFTKGIIFVGENNDKGKVLVQFLKALKLKPKRVVFVDDKVKNVKNVEAALQKEKLPFLGFRYGATDAKVKAFKEDSAKLKLFVLGELPKD